MFTFNKEDYFLSPNKTLALRITKDKFPKDFPLTYRYGETDFVLKDKFHISIFPVVEINAKYNADLNEERILADFYEFIEQNPISVAFTEEYRYVVENDLKSIVVRCQSINIVEFYNFINEKYALYIKAPVPHVTLYTLKEKVGIYLLDQEDLDNKTQIINF
jgi:hypothetical protein